MGYQPQEKNPTQNNRKYIAAVVVLRKQFQDCVNIEFDPQT